MHNQVNNQTKNIRITLAYDGARYLGWQKPEKEGGAQTVSHRLSGVLNRLTGESVSLFPGAKTDPGVHAEALTVSFPTSSGLSPDEIRKGLNQYLPRDIAVLSAVEASQRFRADLNALSRTFECRICTSRICDVFHRQYETHIFPGPSIPLMEQAVPLLLGRHDFRFFSSGRKKKGTEKDILDIQFRQEDNRVILSVTASDFLQQMPALLAGSLLEIGAGRISPEDVSGMLDGSKKAGPAAEAKSLCLTEIQYI